jgi:hypothetical protein
VLPGIAVILIPVIGAIAAYFFAEQLVLPIFAATSIVESVLAGLFIAFREK